MANQENYTLNVNKIFDEVGGQRTENHSYSATNAADLKYMLQLAGVVDYAEQELPCGCTDTCDCDAAMPVNAAMVAEPISDEDYAEPQTAYDYGDDFQPHFGMNDWEANSYEKFVNTPSQNWPVVFEALSNELVDRGLTIQEADEKLFKLLDLGVNEHFDYGHGNPLDNQTTVSIKGMNIDRGSLRKFKQDYVQARYGDNPLSANNEISETIEQKYQRFLKETAIITEKETKLENHRLPVGSVFIAGLPSNGDIQLHVVVKSDKEPTERRGEMDITYDVKLIHVTADGKIKKTENVKKWGSQLNRPSTGGKVYVGKHIGKISNPEATRPDLSRLNLKKLRESINESQNSYTSKENSKGERVSLTKKKNEDGEFTVRFFKNGKPHEPGFYYTDDWNDAVGTFENMKKRVEKIDESAQKKINEEDSFQFRRAIQLAADDYVKKFGEVPNLLNFRMREYAKSIATKFGKDELAIRKELEKLILKKKNVAEAATSIAPRKPYFTPLSADDTLEANLEDNMEFDGFEYSFGDNGAPVAVNTETGEKWITSGGINEPVSDASEWELVANEAAPGITKPKKVVLGKFIKSPELEITAIPVRDKVSGKMDYKVAIVDKFDNNNKQVVLMRGAGTDFNKMIERLKSTNELKFKRAGGVAWLMGENQVDEAGTRLDPKCWDGYKIGKPKTKISPQTGKRVNNCVKD